MLSILSFLTVYLNAAISLITGTETDIISYIGNGFDKIEYAFAAFINSIF